MELFQRPMYHKERMKQQQIYDFINGAILIS